MNTTATQPLNSNLRLLGVIRALVAIGLGLVVYYFSVIQDIGLYLPPLILMPTLMGLHALATWWRAGSDKPVSEAEFFLQLCVDMLAIGVLLYFSGGASNPLISYLLVPIAIGASILRWHFSAALALIGLALYSTLLFVYVPVHALMSHGGGDGGLSLHLIGMWFNFVVSALLISIFIVRMARTISDQRQQLARQREQQMENDRLISIATLAANTAHQLGTPINSIHLLADELNDTAPDINRSLTGELRAQARRCKQILQSLVSTADEAIAQDHSPVLAQAYFHDLVEKWSLLHPDKAPHFSSHENLQSAQIMAPPALEPSVYNLLDNAAQSGGNHIELELRTEPGFVCFSVVDDGPGLAPAVLEKIGQPFNSSKPQGLGIGIYLAQTTVQSLGGRLDIHSDSGGTTVTLRLQQV